MEVRTILWPTDLSRNSIKAAKQVSMLAEKFQAKVILLYVGVDLMTMFPAYGNYPSEDQLKHFQDWELKQAKKQLASVCETELQACPNIDVHLVQGDPATEILKTINDARVDLVVLTTHGRSHDDVDQKSPEFGSVVKKVMANASVPVHLVNPYKA
jgi:nucleotide-binding universal stress UspA family protein